jgi:hypothetical protein
MSEKRERLARIVGNKKDINIALRRLLASGEGTEEPCLQDWLRLEVVGYSLLYQLVAHKRILLRIWGQNYEIILNNGAILAQKIQNGD